MSANEQTVLVIGLGQTGWSCVKYLVGAGYSVVVMDSRSHPPYLADLKANYPTLPIYLGNFALPEGYSFKMAVVSPGIALQHPFIQQLKAQTIPLLGDIELFAQQIGSTPVIGITGTNGKSTVTALMGHLASSVGLRVAVGGNIGTPALDLLTSNSPDLYVLELSSFQLETTYSLNLTAATILNLAPDHGDRYDTLVSYAAAKQRIYHHCAKIVYNRADSYTCPPINHPASLSFGLSIPGQKEFGLRELNGKTYLAYGDQNLLPVSQLKIKGRQNYLNALAALALGHQLDWPLSTMLSALTEFQGLPHRCQWVADIRGVSWYNDSKGTNIAASSAAVEGLAATTNGKLILIAGGQGKQQDFSLLRPVLAGKLRTLILFGEDAEKMATVLSGYVPIQQVMNLAEAVLNAHRIAQPHDIVLLSPACASWDMFENYMHRGQVFMDLVKELAG